MNTFIFEYFRLEISVRNLHHFVYTQNNRISAKRMNKNVLFQNGAAKKREFLIRKKSHGTTKIGKTTFPKEFVNKIWLKVEKHEYIYIFGQSKLYDIAQ